MAVQFTEEQRKCIDARNSNILVSAAAGSGKTAVLVERILSLIMDAKDPVDIDRLLVVTFTNAAAEQMKERIAAAIAKRLNEEPDNAHLKRQEILLHHALITTIDSFCLFIIRNHFNEIGLDPGFRVADPGELKLLKQDIIKALFEELLEKEETKEDFSALLDAFTPGTNQKAMEEIIFKLHEFSESHPWPTEWIRQRFTDYQVEEEGIEASAWGKLLSVYLKQEYEQLIEILEEGLQICNEADGPVEYRQALDSDLEMLRLLWSKSWKDQYELLKELNYARLSTKKMKGVSEEKKALVKALRDQVKADIQTLKKKYFAFSPHMVQRQMEEICRLEGTLLNTVLAFKERFSEAKREKNLLDFSDMEHFALEILTEMNKDVGENGGFIWAPSSVAIDYRTYFKEIMIDEYQDSNLVQEYLLQSISGEWEGNYNRFMVGDLKQSIYKFRMARPEIFLEKYETYSGEKAERRCICLHSNFRSRKQVIDSVNDVFYQLMSSRMGKIDYSSREALYPGAVYPEAASREEYTTELLLLEGAETKERKKEAQMVAHRIKQMVGRFPVADKDTGEIRPACYRDIVVLLRTNAGWDDVFYQEFSKEGIPAVLTGKAGYFSATEVQSILNFLRVIDNPLQDIPLYGVMTSLPGRFSKDEVAIMKKQEKGSLYDNLVRVSEMDDQLSQKAAAFLHLLKRYRDLVTVMPIHGLLREFLKETGYLYYFAALPGGKQRVANVKMLLSKAEVYEKTSYFGLFHFIRYMEQLQKYEIDEAEAGTLDESQDVVRIMSIHKSKGLEFPICFVSGLHKKFNQMDSRQAYIMDMDLGLGLEYRDVKRRIRGEDLRKSVIARKLQLENLGEELRILYVAMTRAKEKLILTGMVKNSEKQMRLYKNLENRKERQLPLWVLVHGGSYLDYLMAALARPCPSIRLSFWNPDMEVKEKTGQAMESRFMRMQLEDDLAEVMAGGESKELKQLKAALSFTYRHENLQGLYSKTTVSELKKKAMEESPETAFSLYEEPVVVPYIPRFMENRQEVSGAVRGTAYHRILELIDFSKLSDWDGLVKEMEMLQEKGTLDTTYPSLIQREKMEKFLSSALVSRMKEADKNGLLYKEKPFVLGLSAARLNPEFPEDEKVLVQGIIDVYFEEAGELVLVDYKTDRISRPQELVLRYREQLHYYRMALEQITGKTVKEQLLYSFALGQVIAVDKGIAEASGDKVC